VLPRATPPPKDPAARVTAPSPPPPPSLPLYVREVMAEARATRLEPVRVLGTPDRAALVMISVVRNEAAVLGDFLAHHRRLGVDRFVMLDNASADATPEILAAQPDVDLYRVERRFLPPMKQGWIMRAIAQYGRGRWYAYADADEHLVFDGAGARTLADLVAFAEGAGIRRVRGQLVDMYGPGPVLAPGAGGGPLAAAFPLFDGEAPRETLCKQRISRHGGPRPRAFRLWPELTKYPLFHAAEADIFDNPHHLYPYKANFVSPCLVGVLHYKFTAGLLAKIGDAVRHGQYYGGSTEYRTYLRVLSADRDLALAYAGSRRYRGPADLVACGLIEAVPWLARRRSLAGLFRTSAPATSARAAPAGPSPRSGC
jgi:hypothetical protein